MITDVRKQSRTRIFSNGRTLSRRSPAQQAKRVFYEENLGQNVS